MVPPTQQRPAGRTGRTKEDTKKIWASLRDAPLPKKEPKKSFTKDGKLYQSPPSPIPNEVEPVQRNAEEAGVVMVSMFILL